MKLPNGQMAKWLNGWLYKWPNVQMAKWPNRLKAPLPIGKIAQTHLSLKIWNCCTCVILDKWSDLRFLVEDFSRNVDFHFSFELQVSSDGTSGWGLYRCSEGPGFKHCPKPDFLCLLAKYCHHLRTRIQLVLIYSTQCGAKFPRNFITYMWYMENNFMSR